jgi:subtilisin family serine protease
VVDTGWHRPAAESGSSTPWLEGVDGDEESFARVQGGTEPEIHAYGGHGTFVAGVLRCIAPQAKVRVEGFLTQAGAVHEFDLVKQLFEAVLVENPPDIISLSAGTRSRESLPLLAFQRFWESDLRKGTGTILVAAAGNDGTQGEFWPAAFPWAVAVGALDSDGHRADFSNFGEWVDVYALGVDVVNAFPNGTYFCREPQNMDEDGNFDVRTFEHGMAVWSGTSFAVPIVSGMIAARMSVTHETAEEAAATLQWHAKEHSVLRFAPAPGLHER